MAKLYNDYRDLRNKALENITSKMGSLGKTLSLIDDIDIVQFAEWGYGEPVEGYDGYSDDIYDLDSMPFIEDGYCEMGYLYEIDERGCFRFYLLGDRSGDIEVLKPHQVDANILFIIHDYIMNYKPNLQNKTTNLFENN